MGANTSGWNFVGTATYDATAQTAVLTQPGALGSAGTVIYKDAVVVDDTTVSFDFRADTTGGRADGLTFFLQTDGAAALGAAGGGLGVAGLHGYAVEFDIYNNKECGDSTANHAGIDTLTPCGLGEPTPVATSGDLNDPSAPDHGVGDIGDGEWRTVVVTVLAGVMSVSVTDPTSGASIAVPNLQSVMLPGFVGGTPYYIGFSGATGAITSRQEIRNVHVMFPATVCL
jgi:hypothetical protein